MHESCESRQQGDKIDTGIVGRKAGEGLPSALKEFVRTTTLSEREFVVTGSYLDEALVESFLFTDNLIPQLFPEFMGLKEVAAVELLYAAQK